MHPCAEYNPLGQHFSVVNTWAQTPQTPTCAGWSYEARAATHLVNTWRETLFKSVQKCWPQLLTSHRRQMKWNAVLILQSQYHPWPNSDYVIICVWRQGWFCQYFSNWFCSIILELYKKLTPHSSLSMSNHQLNTLISPHGRPWLQPVLWWSRISKF